MRDFAGVVRVRVIAANEMQGVAKAADVDEPQIEGEENGTDDEPYDDQLKFGAANGNREEDELGEGLGDWREGLIDRFVDAEAVGHVDVDLNRVEKLRAL
jgi:hypothetical protein